MAEMGQCRSCRSAIRWCVSSKGHRMPVDVEPSPTGNVYLSGEGFTTGGEKLPRALVLGKGDVLDPGVQRFTSHFVTCPDAAQHRRSR